MIYLAAVLIFLLVWTLISAILFSLFKQEKSIDKLKYVDEDYAIKEKLESDNKSRISIVKSLSNLLPKFGRNKKKEKKIEIELMKAELPITVDELIVVKILSSSSFAFLAFALSKNLIIIIIVFILVWNIPRYVISKRKKERLKIFDSQLNEGIGIISNSLKAGYSFLQAIAVVSEEMSDPFAKEFKKLLKEMSLGIPEGDSLNNLQNRIESEDLNLIINAILIQKDIGGNLSEILDNISDTITERQKMKNELKTLTAQGRLAGIILMLMPIIIGIIIFLFNREYMMLLFTTSTGIIMITLAVINQLLGFIMIRKIIKIEM